jgi:hypothetical protein
MSAREVLETLLPAINGIDGGCPVCIERFVDGANWLLKEAGHDFGLVITGEWNDEVAVVKASALKGAKDDDGEFVHFIQDLL